MTRRCGCRSSSGCGTNGRFPMSTRCARRSKPTAGSPSGCSATFRCRIFGMSQSPGTPGAPTMVLRLSVPAGDGFRAVAVDLAGRWPSTWDARRPMATKVAACSSRWPPPSRRTATRAPTSRSSSTRTATSCGSRPAAPAARRKPGTRCPRQRSATLQPRSGDGSACPSARHRAILIRASPIRIHVVIARLMPPCACSTR